MPFILPAIVPGVFDRTGITRSNGQNLPIPDSLFSPQLDKIGKYGKFDSFSRKN